MQAEILRMDRVTYKENGIVQLNQFNLHIFKGEILGLICLNSQGLEALIMLLQQNLPLHYGNIYFKETLVNTYLHNANTAPNKVVVIEKKSRLVDSMTVSDNVFVLRSGFRKYLIAPRVLATQLHFIAKELGVEIDADARVEDLSFFKRCVVELYKAVASGAKLIVIRDISNFVSVSNLAKLQEILQFYAQKGVSFLYVCNHHEEIFALCKRAAIMQNGQIIKVLPCNAQTETIMQTYARPFHTLVQKQRQSMEIQEIHAAAQLAEETVFAVQNLACGANEQLDFTVKKGECIVLQDMENTILQPLLSILSGNEPPQGGTIELAGHNVTHHLYRRRDIAILAEKPIETMLFPDLSYLDNLCFTLDQRMTGVWCHARLRNSIAAELAPELGDVFDKDINELTVAQRYTLVYQRILLQKPQIVFCVQPFASADMVLRMHIIQLLQKLLQKQIAVVILAVNLSDSLALANRLLLVEHGCVTQSIARAEFATLSAHAPWEKI